MYTYYFEALICLRIFLCSKVLNLFIAKGQHEICLLVAALKMLSHLGAPFPVRQNGSLFESKRQDTSRPTHCRKDSVAFDSFNQLHMDLGAGQAHVAYAKAHGAHIKMVGSQLLPLLLFLLESSRRTNHGGNCPFTHMRTPDLNARAGTQTKHMLVIL